MKQLAYSRRFLKQLDRLSTQDQEAVEKAFRIFWGGLQKSTFPKGLGLKKMAADKYEIRVDLKIRIAVKVAGDTFTLHLIGNHEDIRNFLKNY